MAAAAIDATICSICMHSFSSDAQGPHTPKVLPCGHTFCKECVDALAAQAAGSIKCAVCQVGKEREEEEVCV